MKDDINLVAVGRKKSKDRVFAISLGVFLVAFIAAVAVLLYSLVVSGKASTLGAQAEDLRGRISALSTQKQKILTVNERLATSRKILLTRKKIDQRVSSILDTIPDQISIDRVVADDKGITVGLLSANLADLDSLLDNNIPTLGKDKTLGLTKINLASFVRQDNGYLLSIEFIFKGTPASINPSATP